MSMNAAIIPPINDLIAFTFRNGDKMRRKHLPVATALPSEAPHYCMMRAQKPSPTPVDTGGYSPSQQVGASENQPPQTPGHRKNATFRAARFVHFGKSMFAN